MDWLGITGGLSSSCLRDGLASPEVAVILES